MSGGANALQQRAGLPRKLLCLRKLSFTLTQVREREQARRDVGVIDAQRSPAPLERQSQE
jgi:hypothetical protein